MRKNAYILLAALGLASCNYLEIEPVGKVIPHKTSEYRALLTEGYSRFPYTSSKAYTGLLSDEVGMFHEGNFFDSSDAIALSYNYTWQYETQMWEYPYQYYYRAAFQANAVIDGVADADDDSSEDKRQILGEAYAMRAYAHFDLVNLYGKPYDPQTASTDRGVPLSTYIDIEQKYRPTNVAAVYRQIVEDIEAAERTMTLEKQESPTLNYRFSLDALAAFKARVMLYMRNWQAAYDAATGLLPKYELVDFNASPESGDLPWKATSPEAILAWERPFGGGNGDLRGRQHPVGQDPRAAGRSDGQPPQLPQPGECLRRKLDADAAGILREPLVVGPRVDPHRRDVPHRRRSRLVPACGTGKGQGIPARPEGQAAETRGDGDPAHEGRSDGCGAAAHRDRRRARPRTDRRRTPLDGPPPGRPGRPSSKPTRTGPTRSMRMTRVTRCPSRSRPSTATPS